MKHQLLLLLIISMLISCQRNQAENENAASTEQEKVELPFSKGNEFDIIIVGEKIRENEKLQSLLDSIFMQEIPILPQPEKLFIPTYVNLTEFDEEYAKYRNILILKSNSTDRLMEEFEKSRLPDNLIKEDKKDLKHYIYIDNHWAEPQLVVYLTASDPVQLEEQVQEESDQYVTQFDDLSKERIKVLLYNMGENSSISSELYMKHGIGLRIPKNYRIAKNYKQDIKDPEMEGLDLDRLMWIRDNQGLPDINLLLYSKKLADSSQLMPEELINQKNRVTEKIVEGGNEGSYIITEFRVPFQIDFIDLNGYDVIEIRGLWQTEGDDMGGPFIFYTIPDWENNKIYFIDAFVFAPNLAKKLPMKTLEVIMSSLNLGK